MIVRNVRNLYMSSITHLGDNLELLALADV